MNKAVKLIMTGVLSLSLISVTSAESHAATKAKAFKNCTEMQKTYKGGVSKKAGLKKPDRLRQKRQSHLQRDKIQSLCQLSDV